MTYLTLESIKQPLEEFNKFDADTKLALLWYGYLDIKDNLNPAPASDVEALGNALFDKVREMSHQEQLQAQRNLVESKDTPISHEYGALSSSGKLEFWLLLARGMEASTVVNVPDGYNLPEETNEFVEMIKKLDFEERINFTRNAIEPMGIKQGIQG